MLIRVIEARGKSRRFLQLEDLYVKPEYRRKGIGKALFKQLAIIAQEKVRAPTSFI
jgi:GNAT superfamily N-acetyltransferase